MFISDPEERAEVLEANDPIEGVNRHIFAVNLAIDTFLLRPVAVLYRDLVPEPGKGMVRNFVHNLKLPFTALNDLAQGETGRAETAFSRFLVNSVVGVGGLFDPATDLGLPYHEEDFGQTLAAHGSEEGPYLMLPILGPSNLRDAIGVAVRYFTDPVGIAADQADIDDFGIYTGGAEAVDTRSRHIETFDTLQQQSLDLYAAVRSLYRQRREAEIRNADVAPLPGSPAEPLPAGPQAGTPQASQLDAPNPVPRRGAAAEEPRVASGDHQAAGSDGTQLATLDRRTPQHMSAPEYGAPAETPSREPASVGPSTEPAEAPVRLGSDRFAEAARAFEEAARSFDAIARSPSDAR